MDFSFQLAIKMKLKINLFTISAEFDDSVDKSLEPGMIILLTPKPNLCIIIMLINWAKSEFEDLEILIHLFHQKIPKDNIFNLNISYILSKNMNFTIYLLCRTIHNSIDLDLKIKLGSDFKIGV